MKKFLLKTSLISIIISNILSTQTYANTKFNDVKENHWAYTYITDALNKGWVNGIEENIFKPDDNITVGQFYSMLCNAFFKEEVKDIDIEDIQFYLIAYNNDTYKLENQWFSPYIVTAMINGFYYYTENSNLIEYANTNLNRRDMANIIGAGLLYSLDIDVPEILIQNAKNNIPDFEEIDYEFQDSIAKVYALGIITGIDEKGNFAGDNNVTRAQACAILNNIEKAIGNKLEAFPEQKENTLSNGKEINDENIREILYSLKDKYPQGRTWNNSNTYFSEINSTYGSGCAAFSYILSDVAFGNLPITKEYTNFDEIRVGDILRVDNDTHSVVVLEKNNDSIIVAEGNFNNSINWGRKITKQNLEKGNFFGSSRYPE